MNVTRNNKMNNVKWKSTNMNPTYECYNIS